MTDLIYKVVHRDEWEASLPNGAFQGSDPDLKDGFIHFSTKEQLPTTINKFFAGQKDLLLVSVRTDAVVAALRWEPEGDPNAYPHLYGTLPIEAVASVETIETT